VSECYIDAGNYFEMESTDRQVREKLHSGERERESGHMTRDLG